MSDHHRRSRHGRHNFSGARRYTKVWDVDKVLAHLEAGPSLADLSDMDLSVKTATLTFIIPYQGSPSSLLPIN